MRIFLDVTDSRFLAANRSNAASKPRQDVQSTAIRMGHKPFVVPNRWYKIGRPATLVEKVKRKMHLAQMALARHRLSNRLKGQPDSEVLAQYPFLVPEMLGFLQVAKQHGAKVTVLLHDFYRLRENRMVDSIEDWLLQQADCLIVHSQPMQEALQSMGYRGEFRVLGYFDYLLPGKCHQSESVDCTRILFAGNLSKAPFIGQLGKLPQHKNLEILLYGLPAMGSHIGAEVMPGCRYMGAFDGNNPVGIEGHWGLVWDGDSLDTCSGAMGCYLRYNAPFKLSLYLAFGLPVIVWKESAMASYVAEQHLGICISSLHEMYEALAGLSVEQRQIIMSAVQKASHRVRQGWQLEHVLSDTCKADK